MACEPWLLTLLSLLKTEHMICLVYLTYPNKIACPSALKSLTPPGFYWFSLQKTSHLCTYVSIDHEPPPNQVLSSSSRITATTSQLLSSLILVLVPLVLSAHCNQHDLYNSSLIMSRICDFSCQIKSSLTLIFLERT